MGPDPKTANAVYEQLLEDYPPEALSWIKGAHWDGPLDVPWSAVDYTHEKSWAASHEPEKVHHFAAKVRGGWRKPVILVKTPRDRKLKALDGHHRVLAYREANKPIYAYVAHVGADSGPWDEMHSLQYEGDSFKDSTGSAPGKGTPRPPESRPSISYSSSRKEDSMAAKPSLAALFVSGKKAPEAEAEGGDEDLSLNEIRSHMHSAMEEFFQACESKDAAKAVEAFSTLHDLDTSRMEKEEAGETPEEEETEEPMGEGEEEAAE